MPAIAESKCIDSIECWREIFITQYIPVKKALFGSPEIRNSSDLITLIAKINFGVDYIPEDILFQISDLVVEMEQDPSRFVDEYDIDLESDDDCSADPPYLVVDPQ